MLRTSSILLSRSETDDIRISVMSRHTLNDGLTPNPAITSVSFDEHLPEFGPPPKLIGDYYKRGLLWEEFATRYTDYLRSIGGHVLSLANRAVETDITLLCIEPTPDKCHRQLLAQQCLLLVPELSLDIQ